MLFDRKLQTKDYFFVQNKYQGLDLNKSRKKYQIQVHTFIPILYKNIKQQMEHPIKELINSLFAEKSQEKRNKWAQYLIDQEFDTIEDLKTISLQTWVSLSPNIPLGISSVIKNHIDPTSKIHKEKQANQVTKKIYANIKEKTEPLSQNNGLTPSLKALQDIIKNDEEFGRVRVEIESITQLEDIQKLLHEYVVLKKAKQLATGLFKQLNKEAIDISPIKIFLTKLRRNGVSQEKVTDIDNLINKGKKLATKHQLYEELGSNNGQAFFQQMLKFFVEKPSKPVQESKFIKHKNGLDLYQYKDIMLQSQKTNAKTLIVFGQTGCGKSTFLNAIVNYLTGVEMQDTFRYIVIVEDDSSQLKSITSSINDYYIKDTRLGQVYRLIDTPGFGDTQGIQKDKQLVKKISLKFKKDIECIHSILFVMKASTTRVTSYQQYVFQNVMDLFDKQIAPNFVFIFTFSDSGKPQVLPSVKDIKYGFGKYWDQIIEPRYIQVNNCGFFEKIDDKDKIKTHYWKIGIEGLQRFFKKINQIQPKSLYLSRQMIKTKEALNIQIQDTTQIIQLAISKRQNIKRHIQAIVFHKEEINNNKNFTYQVQEDQWYAENTTSNVTRCNTTHCFTHKNCHINCRYGDGEDKKKCSAMNQQGNCNVCGCHYSVHTNSKIVRKVRQVMKKMVNSENKMKYEKSSSQMKTSEAALKDLINQLETEMKKVINATKKMGQLQQKLRKVQMSDRKPQSTRAYLQYLIHSEYREQSPNYEKRVNGYKEAIKQLQLQEKILQGSGSKDMQKIVKELNEEIAKNIIDSVELGFFQRIKKFLFG